MDTYEGICEELALAAGASPPFCICRIPLPDPLSPKLMQALSKIVSRTEVAIARRGQSCRSACLERNKGCHSWSLVLFNDQRVLRESWKQKDFYPVANLTSGEVLEFRDIEVSSVSRAGSAIRIIRRSEKVFDKWTLELAAWGEGPSCEDESLYGFALCPCF